MLTLGTALIALHLQSVLAEPHPLVTAAAAAPHLAARQADPALVGYVSTNGGYADGRTCDYPATISSSGSYVQCCAPTGACPFYTACVSNTLVGGGATVPCDTDPALTCNTGIVVPTPGANGGNSYLACWQRTLGSGAFTFVRDIGTASVAAGSTGSSTLSGTRTSASSGSRTSSGAQSSSTARTASSGSSSSTATASSNVGSAGEKGSELLSGVVGAVVLLAQAIM